MSPGSPEQQAREEIDKALDAAGWVIQDRAELTLIAYGAFAEALKHWEVSRIGTGVGAAVHACMCVVRGTVCPRAVGS